MKIIASVLEPEKYAYEINSGYPLWEELFKPVTELKGDWGQALHAIKAARRAYVARWTSPSGSATAPLTTAGPPRRKRSKQQPDQRSAVQQWAADRWPEAIKNER